MTARRCGVVAVVLLLTVAGCGAGTQPQVESGDGEITPKYLGADEYTAGLTEQKQLMADGSVTKPEYELAAQRYRHCLTAHGLDVRDQGWDPVTGQQLRIYYGSTTKSEQDIDGYGDECLAAHFADISEAYGASVPPIMADSLMQSVQHCLSSKGITTTGQERSLPALHDSAPNKDKEVTDCVATSMKQLYPDSPVAIGR